MRRSKLHLILIFALALLGCSQASKQTGPGGNGNGDGFAVGSQPLALEEAPPGLCEGEGAEKECEGECVSQPDQGDNDSFASPNASAGAGGQSGFGSAAGTGGAGGMGFTGGASAEPPQVDAGCDELLPDGGIDMTCGSDAAVASSANALITDVPTCETIDGSAPYTLYMSADDSNSMASPAIARRMIRSGEIVPAWLVRSYEFLNYYDFAFEPAAAEQVRIVPQLSSCPINGQLSLQVALQAEARSPAQRKPLNLTFVLDTSGSMAGTPLELQRAAMIAIAGQLAVGDVVSMVTWNVEQRDLLVGHEVSGPNDAVLTSAINSVQASGGTDLAGGLARGYQLAQAQKSAARINRVILISDGIANVGVTDEALIGQHADDEEGEEGIYLTGIGVGDGVNDTLMNAVTDAGRGAYVYLDSAGEAQRMLGDRFLSVVDLAARNVRLEVTLPYYLTLEKFFGEVASTDASVVRPQHLGPNDAMLFFQVLKACDPALIHGDDRIKLRATWETPFEREAQEAVIETTLNALAGDDAQLTKAAAVAGYAEALIAASVMPENGAQAIDTALANVLAAENSATDPDLLEIAELLRRYHTVVSTRSSSL